MYDSLISIAFVLFIIAVYKNIFKIYKPKSTIYKIVLGLGLLFGSYVLSAVFVILLNLNLLLSIIFTGFFAEIISLIIYLKHLKKINKKSKEYKSTKLELILSIIIPLIIILIFLSINFFNKINCTPPNEIVGETECCIPNYDYGIKICTEEAKKLDDQLIYAIENNIITTKSNEEFLGGFSLLIPEGYIAVRNAKAGLYDYPLVLISFDEFENVIYLTIMYSESINYSGALEDIFPEMKQGLLAAAPYSKLTDPQFSENKGNGTETVTFNRTLSIDGQTTYGAVAFIKSNNKLVAIQYSSNSKELYDYYLYEFDEMVDSVIFK